MTNRFVGFQVRKAVVTALKANAPLVAAVVGIYDQESADNTAAPYITVSEITETPWNVFSKRGKEALFQVSIFTESDSYKPAYDIANLLNPLLDAINLSVTGFSTVRFSFASLTEVPDPDGVTRQLAIRYTGILQEA